MFTLWSSRNHVPTKRKDPVKKMSQLRAIYLKQAPSHTPHDLIRMFVLPDDLT